MSENVHFRYGDYQAAGRLVQRWIEDSTTEGCPVFLSKLKIKHLNQFQEIESELEVEPWLPRQIEDHFDELNTSKPASGEWARFAIEELNENFDRETQIDKHRVNVWAGQIAPGVLIVEEIKRTNGPHSSEIGLAFYKSKYPIDNLKYVYMLDVRNEQTLGFVEDYLYTEENGLEWPDEELCDWHRGTAEFEGLLGTRLGKTVAYMILGSFRRGTRRISRIRTYNSLHELTIQFMIEDIPGAVQGRDLKRKTPQASSTRSRKTTSTVSDSDYTGPITRSRTRKTEAEGSKDGNEEQTE